MKKITILLFVLFSIISNAQSKEINVLSKKLSISKYNPLTNEIESPVESDQINIINIDKNMSYVTIQLTSKTTSEIIETIKYKILDYRVEDDKNLGETLKLYSKDEKGVTYDFFFTPKLFIIRSKYKEFGYIMIYELFSPDKEQ